MEGRRSILLWTTLSLLLILTISSIPIDTCGSTAWTETSQNDFEMGEMKDLSSYGHGNDSKITLQRLYDWTELLVNDHPPARFGHRMTTIGDTGYSVVFGGWDRSYNYLNDTWLFNISTNTWEMVNSINSPSNRSEHNMAYIDGTDKVVLFGGQFKESSSIQFDDTWIFDLSERSWTEIFPTQSPTANFAHAMATIIGTDRVLMYGGFFNGYDTWIFDLSASSWMKRTPSSKPTNCFLYPAMASIDNSDKVLLFGGTDSYLDFAGYSHFTWIYDDSEDSWTNPGPVNIPFRRAYHSMATITATDQVVINGGYYYSSGPVYHNDTWIYDLSENNWTKVHTTDDPGYQRSSSLTTIDQTRGGILFGGRNHQLDPEVPNGTWNLNLSSYKEQGAYVSRPYYIGDGAELLRLEWDDAIPAQTQIEIRIRSAGLKEGLEVKEFLGPDGTASSYYQPPSTKAWSGHFGDTWFQYQVKMITSERKISPELRNLSLIYNYLPSVSNDIPNNGGIINDSTPAFQWSFSDNDSLGQSGFQLQISRDQAFDDIQYDSGIQGTKIEEWMFPSGTDFNRLEDGFWYYRVKVKDSDGSWGSFSDPSGFLVDTISPISSIEYPSSGSILNSLVSISGQTSDGSIGSGPAETEISIFDNNTQKFWDGSGWTVEENWIPTSGISQWSCDTSHIGWVSGNEYQILSLSFDIAGNHEVLPDKVSFIFDN
ncbi:MAG: Kelch repeat-containing protein, partial [Thermoplasmatota archaeon]